MSVDLNLPEPSGCEVGDLLRVEAVSPDDLLDTLTGQVARSVRRVSRSEGLDEGRGEGRGGPASSRRFSTSAA
jgi:hypothetical protein